MFCICFKKQTCEAYLPTHVKRKKYASTFYLPTPAEACSSINLSTLIQVMPSKTCPVCLVYQKVLRVAILKNSRDGLGGFEFLLFPSVCYLDKPRPLCRMHSTLPGVVRDSELVCGLRKCALIFVPFVVGRQIA